jgi:hypothetical protein
MRNPLHASLALVLGIGFGSMDYAGALGEPLPEAPRAGILVLPRGSDPEADGPGSLDSEGLEAHLASYHDPAVELSYPAGSWFEPPPGLYRIWLQGGWRMTPFSSVISFSGAGTLRSVLPLGEAGRVRLPGDLSAVPNLELHLLHAGGYREAGFMRWEIAIRRPLSEVVEGVLMPVGKAVGALWDAKHGRYVALSRPFVVRGHETVEVPLKPPGGGALLVAELKRDGMAETAADLEARMVVKQKAGERPADLYVLTTDRVYAFWYRLRPGAADLTGVTGQDFLPPRKLDLRPGRIESVHAELKHRPNLDVQLSLPDSLWRGGLALEVRNLSTGEILDHRSLEKTAARLYRFERVQPALLEVELQTRLGSCSRQVDLSSGEDGFLLLKPEAGLAWTLAWTLVWKGCVEGAALDGSPAQTDPAIQ